MASALAHDQKGDKSSYIRTGYVGGQVYPFRSRLDIDWTEEQMACQEYPLEVN
jgi:hypothetical protein